MLGYSGGSPKPFRKGNEMNQTISTAMADRLMVSMIKSSCVVNSGYRLKAYYSVYEKNRLGAHVILQRDIALPFAVYWFAAEVPGFTDGAHFATEDQALNELDRRRSDKLQIVA